MLTVCRTFADRLFVGSFLLLLILSAGLYVSGRVAHPIKSDGWGYYLYLPALFIHGDPKFAFVDQPELFPRTAEYRPSDGTWQGLTPVAGGYLNKYALGPAILEAPFFLAALAVAKSTQPRVQGLEPPFQFGSIASAAFYFALGLALCYRTARLRAGRTASLLAITFAVLTTNLLYYATVDGSYAHIYGFCLVAALSFLTMRRVERCDSPPWGEFAVFGLLLGVAIMVRPTNAIAGLLFVLFIRRARAPVIVRGAAVAAAAAIAGALPQMLWWYATTGQFLYYSYVDEGFRFLRPEVGNYLFSVRKGVFFWHPAYLLMMLVAVLQVRDRRLEGLVVAIIIALNLYIGASWSDWTFGSSFGCRQIVEMLPVLILPLAVAIERLPAGGSRRMAAGIAVALFLLNAFNLFGIAAHRLPTNNTTAEIYLAFWSDTLGLRR